MISSKIRSLSELMQIEVSVDPDTPISSANAKRNCEEHRPHSASKTTSLTSNAKQNLRAAINPIEGTASVLVMP